MTTENQTHIPEGWKENELGAVIVEKAKSTIKVSDAANFGEFPFFTSGDSILLHDRKIIEGENLFLATGGVANIKYFDGEAAYSTDTFAISTNEEAKARYLYYYLLSKVGYINKNYFEGSGLKHLQKKDFRKHVFALPSSPNEQQKIASILSKLDEAITQTEQLIDKYKKIKEGLMHDLLTRGIDKQGNIRSEETHKFKDSPLGRIPVEWEVKKLIDLCIKIVDCPHSTPNYLEEGILVARTQNIKQGRYLIETSSYVCESEYINRVSRLIPEYGDIIFTREAPIGEAFVIPKEMKICLGQRVMLFRVNSNHIISEFLVELIYSEWIKRIFDSINGGSTVSHLNVEDVKKLCFLKPPLIEQKQIMKILNKTKESINSHISIKEKLELQKSGLMQDLLTGKVRVSNCEEQKEQTSNVNVVPLKTQAHNQHIEDAVLIGAIVNAFYSDKYTLGRKKIQKLLYLVRRHQEASVACFKKKAAGPYADEVRYKGGEPIAKANKYITNKTNNLGTVFSKGENIEKALAYIEKWEMLSDIDWLLTQFKYTKVDQLELIATIDMARCDLEKEAIPVSLSTIKHLIATNEEWKAKLKKDYFDDFCIQRGIDESYKLFGE